MQSFIYSVVVIFLVLGVIDTRDSCSNQFYLNSLEDNKVQTKLSSFKDCRQISFEGSEKLNSHLGSIRLTAEIVEGSKYSLNISFNDIKWKRAHLRLSEEGRSETSICKVYSTGSQVHLPISEAFETCFNLGHYNTSVNYVLEFKGELNTDILYKRIMFKFPAIESFANTTSLSKKSIFCNVDVSSNYEIVLKIQRLPAFYNIAYYKVEVFRDGDNSNSLLDVRMLKSEDKPELSFEYITYNEEGYYFFKVGVVSKVCPEDECFKTVSPKVYIRRKYPPLVIGIVGASFLIPFVLFILHMWTRRSQLQDDTEEPKEKVFLVYNQTPDKHYLIVKSLEKSLKTLTNTQIVSKITEASHIIYICGTHIFEPDPIVHKHLVIEANKAVCTTDILIVAFPYSTKEVPPYLKNCLRFELMQDFPKFIHTFNCEAEFENNTQYLDLDGKVRAAQIQTEPKKIILNMPIIIVTEQCDSDIDPKEADAML
ncbi:uncharacterized protein [Euwallacea fornicatus]|uniref:uncharacterized protein n=1 Tax=Euwallacea fornicatus TaxID=995702 RepID=UPI00338D5088